MTFFVKITCYILLSTVLICLVPNTTWAAKGWMVYPEPTWTPEYEGDPRACVLRGKLVPSDEPPCLLVCPDGKEKLEMQTEFPEGSKEFAERFCGSLAPGDNETFDLNGCTAYRATESESDKLQPIHFEGHPRCAKVSGDPHLRNLDGKRYGLQTTGEFVAIDSIRDDLQIQFRLEARSDDARVSYTTAVAASMNGHRVMLAANAETRVQIDGETVELADREVLQFDDDQATGLIRRGNRYTLIWSDGSNLHVDIFGRYVNAYFLASESRDGHLTGLFGDGDGELTANDFLTRAGKPLTSDPEFELLHGEFAESWRVIPEESLFDYAAGESSTTFERAGVPTQRAELTDLDAETRASAEARCRAAGVHEQEPLRECTIDLGFSGDAAFIESALTQQAPSDGKTRGGPVIFATRQIKSGAPLAVTFTGQREHREDMIALALPGKPGRAMLSYVAVQKGSPASLLAPDKPGEYEIRYILGDSSRAVLARRPLRVMPVTASIKATAEVARGEQLDVLWTGPANPYDYIAISIPDSHDRASVRRVDTGKGSPAQLIAPDEPGRYELRYVQNKSRTVLARQGLTVR